MTQKQLQEYFIQIGSPKMDSMKTWQSIGPQTLLEVGTPVLVQGLQGKVIKAEIIDSSNQAGKICLHTCKFTSQKIVTNLWIKWQRIKAKTKSVNYSFIQAYF